MSRLHRLVSLGDYQKVNECLAEGSNVNAQGVRGSTPLAIAARNGHTAIVQLLLDSGADPDLVGKNGWTPLHEAAGKGNLEILEMLLAAGANPDPVAYRGYTPALWAAHSNRKEVVELLASHGADLIRKDDEGLSAQDWLEVGGVFGQMQKRIPGFPESMPVYLERTEAKVRELMATTSCAEEFAAYHGRNTLIWGFGNKDYDDPAVKAWAYRVHEIISNLELLVEFEEQYLTGETLEEARKERRRPVSSLERQKRRVQRSLPPTDPDP